ncbi:Protein kinase of the Mitotic Exit Network [Rhizina undulata]
MPTLAPIPARPNGRPNERPRTPSRPSTASSSKENEGPTPSGPLADYILGDCLGKGAFGSVYRALNYGTGETVAVKQIKLADLPKSELRVIMLEIDLLKNLNHPNIVQYHGFVKTADSLYIVLEYCENGSLHSICKNFGKFPENLVGLYMTQVLRGLLYLHDQGVIHRDIKGANILTTKDGLVKLADFGVATRTSGLSDSSVVGTPYWMAPEVIELAGATTASDIWSVGCTVVELLDGKPPYYKLASMQALFRIVNDDHPPLPEGSSPAVRDFLMQCFQKDPNLRVSARKLLKHPWIVNAKRSDSVVRTDEAVKSVQQWNEALRSPNAGSVRKPARTSGSSPNPKLYNPDYSSSMSTPSRGQLALIGRNRSHTEAFMSPESNHEDDNWDDDFASIISPSALQLPRKNMMEPHPLGGSQSSERLRTFASNDGANESWDDNFEGELTVKHTGHMDEEEESMQTIRPYFPRQTEPPIYDEPPMRPVTEKSPPPPEPSPPALFKPRRLMLPTRNSRPTSMFREDPFEDYSDLAPENEASFAKKVDLMKDASLSPRLFHPSDLKSLPRPSYSSQTGSLRRQMPVGETERDVHVMRRSRSSLEIQRYAEAEGEEDYSDIFGSEAGTDETGSETSGDEQSLLLTKLSWLGDEEIDEDDPFSQLEEGFDETDLEANIARDKYARLCLLVDNLVSSLKTTQTDDELEEIACSLINVLAESPDSKDNIIGAHGMLPILEVLETCKKREVIVKLLKIVNAIIFDDVEIQENLCFVGGIPIITKFASKIYPASIRLEAAAFVRQMYQTSTLTLQMFVSCGGLNVLVEFLEEDYEAQKDLVLIGVNGIWNVFEMQGPTPKNDFCRIFSRNSVLDPLSLALSHVLDEDSDLSDLCVERIVNIFYIFSQAENYVKELVADRIVLKRILKDLKRMSAAHQVIMLKFIKNLSMLSATLDTLQNSNAIEVLTDLLTTGRNSTHFREISNQILNTMYNLCRLSKSRQEEAALNGIIPLLQTIVSTDRPLKEFALPILCDMAHSGKVCRKILWQNNGLSFYISLLSDPYWQVTALDAIFIWLQEETARVEEKLLNESFTTEIIRCFTQSKTNAFENTLEPLQKLLRLSPPIAHAVGKPQFFARILQKLGHNKAVVRLNLLRILRTICEASEQKEALIRIYNMHNAIQRLAERDSAVLVRNIAGDLIKACAEREREKRKSQPVRRPSSASMASPLGPSPSSSRRPHVSSLWGSYDGVERAASDRVLGGMRELNRSSSSQSLLSGERKKTRLSNGSRTSNKYVPKRSRGGSGEFQSCE